jgi:hypothetical protein
MVHTKSAADAQGRECESCELHIGGLMKIQISLEKYNECVGMNKGV